MLFVLRTNICVFFLTTRLTHTHTPHAQVIIIRSSQCATRIRKSSSKITSSSTNRCRRFSPPPEWHEIGRTRVESSTTTRRTFLCGSTKRIISVSSPWRFVERFPLNLIDVVFDCQFTPFKLLTLFSAFRNTVLLVTRVLFCKLKHGSLYSER